MSTQQGGDIAWSIRGSQLLLLSIILLPALEIVVFIGVKQRRHPIEPAYDRGRSGSKNPRQIGPSPMIHAKGKKNGRNNRTAIAPVA